MSDIQSRDISMQNVSKDWVRTIICFHLKTEILGLTHVFMAKLTGTWV
jgi:hypothetical protein